MRPTYRAGFLTTAPLETAARYANVEICRRYREGCIVGDSSIRVRCCIVSCRRCCTQRTTPASAALRIALSVFAVFLPPSPGGRPPLDMLFFPSPPSFIPFASSPTLSAAIDRSRGGPIKAHPPQVVSRSSRVDSGEGEGDGRRG